MVIAFFDNKGMGVTNWKLRGTTVKADYIAGVLRNFLKDLHQKLPDCCLLKWVFLLGQCTGSRHLESAGVSGPKKSDQLVPHSL
jgi:hypothetical protein